MNFLNDTTLEEITDKKVGIIIRSNSATLDTITGQTFLNEGRLFFDCIPALRRKHVVAVPDDASVARAQVPNPPWEFAVFIHPNSEAGRFIKSLLDLKIISQN